MTMYFDGHATTPLAPQVRDAMIAAWRNTANAHSEHATGAIAALAVERARAAVAALIGGSPSEVIFTSGATEANNLAILGIARSLGALNRKRLVVSAIEHKAILEPAYALQREGFEVVVAPVDSNGVVDLRALGELVDSRVLLVSVMAANNETGVVQPIREAAVIAHDAGALMHSDAAQAAGKISLDVSRLDIDYLSLSSHKMYGPFGIGALYIADSAPRPAPLMFGGGQQGGMRPGTVPVPLCVGFGIASDLATQEMPADAAHGSELRERFLLELRTAGLSFGTLGESVARLPGSLALQLNGVSADSIADILAPDMAVSTGSACTAREPGASHVLTAMGLRYAEAKSVLRLFFNRYNTAIEAKAGAQLLAAAAAKERLATGGSHQ